MQNTQLTGQPDNRPARLYFVDLLETIAIFMVLAYHGTNYDYGFLQDGGNVLFFLRYFYRTILSCCVPLFFLVNGFLLLNRPFDLKKHILKIFRFIILAFLWGVIDLFLLMFIRHEFLSVKDFLLGVWQWKQGWINHLWYMPALVVVYFLFPLIKTVFDHRRDIFYFFTIAAAVFTLGNTAINIAASVAAHFILGKNTAYTLNWFNGFNPFRGLFGYSIAYFCIGGIVNEIPEKLKFLKKTWVCVALILTSMLGLFGVGVTLSHIVRYSWDVVWNGYDTVFTLINVICLFSLCARYKGEKKPLRQAVLLVSTNTLGIYFIHVLFNQSLKPHVEKIALVSNIPGNILYAFLILLLSLGSVLIIRKIPLLRRLVM